MEKLCRVTITDIKGGGHVVEVKASSLFEAVAQAVKSKGGHIATDGFQGVNWREEDALDCARFDRLQLEGDKGRMISPLSLWSEGSDG